MAEQALTLAFALEPEMAWHGRMLAEFLERQGRPADALRVTRAALEFVPGDPTLTEQRERLSPAVAP